MTEKTIIKRIIITTLLLIALVVGYVFTKPYLPGIKNKYDELSSAISQVISNQPETSSADSESSQAESSTLTLMETSQETTSQSQQESTSQESSQIATSTSEELTESESQTEILEKLKLEDYVLMTYTGKTGEGQAKAKLNIDKLLEDLTSLDLGKKDLENLKLEVNPHLTLSNGDQIDVVLQADKEFMDLFQNTSISQTVTGLRKALNFTSQQLKSGLEVDFVGYSGLARAEVQTNFSTPFEDLQVVNLNPDQKLKNNDKVTFELTEASKLFLEEQGYDIENKGQVEFTVTGLEEPFVINQDLINKHVVVSFLGTSGAGLARIDTTFQPPLLDYLKAESFDIENNGQIKNDQTIKISIKEDVIKTMEENGIVLDKETAIERTASNMPEVALSFKDLKDWKTIIDKIDQKVKQKYPDTLFGSYDIKVERYYYRPFHTANDLLKLENVTQDGTIIGVYTITTYDREKKQVRNTETEIYGFTDLFVDKEMKVNMDKLIEYQHKFDNTYTLEAVFQLLEGYNFKAVKLKE